MVDCVDRLKESFADLPEEVIRDIVKSLDELRGRADYFKGAKLLRDQTVQEAEMAVEFTTRQLVAKQRFRQFAETPEFKGFENDMFLAKFQGVDHLVKGGNDNFMQTRQVVRDRHLNILDKGLRPHYSIIADGKSDEAIADAIDMLNQNKSIDGFDAHVRESAQAIKAVNKSLIDTLQENGVIIRERADFITRQSHNRDKILGAKFDDWYAEVEGRLDKSKTFGAETNEIKHREILRSVYNDIVSGDMENNIGSFGGKRVLHFKSGVDWAKYNAKFGHGSIVDSVVASISSASKSAASSRVLGPDGRSLWDSMEKEVASGMEPMRKAKFMDTSIGGEKRQRDNWLKEMYGYDRHPGRELVAKFQRNVNLLQSGAKLGSVLPTTLTDIAFSSMNFRAATGARGFVEFDNMKSFFTALPKEELEFWANATDMYFGDMLADTFDRYGSFNGGGRGGFFQRFNKLAITLSGLERQSATAKVANARLFSLELGKNRGKGFGEINPRLRAGLERFNIGEKEWDTIRTSAEEYRPGAIAITGESVRSLDLPNKAKNELAIKVQNYLGDMARVGSPEASGRERATITQGLSQDDPMGAFLRMAGQFKSFSLAVPRVLRRITLSNPENKGRRLLDNFRNEGDLSLLAATLTEASLLAGAGIIAKDALKGKSREIDGTFMLDAIGRGAVPITGVYMLDALRGEYDQFGRSLFKDLAGPTLSQVDDVVRLLSGAVRMDSKAGKSATKLIMNNLPGANLPFVKVGLNKLFLTDFQEYLSPGYELRLRQRAGREGTDFLFNPL